MVTSFDELQRRAPEARGKIVVYNQPYSNYSRTVQYRVQGAVVHLLRRVRQELPDKTIWAFSGYLFDKDILSGRLGDCSEYLSYLDVLVDGPFIEAKKDLNLRFRGSSNQRLIDVPKSLKAGVIVPWEDWQGDRKGMI